MNKKVLQILEFDKITERLQDLAACPAGKAACRSLEPMSGKEDIEQALRETTDALARTACLPAPSFSGTSDIRPYITRLEKDGVLNAAELLDLAGFLSVCSAAKTYGTGQEDGVTDSLSELFGLIYPLDHLRLEISRCIISEDEISDSASPALRDIRRSISLAGERVRSRLQSMLQSHSQYLQDSIVTMRDGRYCLPVKAEHKNNVAGIVHGQSATGSTYFIEPMSVVELNNELRRLFLEETREINAILERLSLLAAAQCMYLKADYELIGRLDFIFAKAALSYSMDGTSPIINTEGRIVLTEARHPLLDPASAVPVSLTLGCDFDQLIITGPNTGGKTVTIKTVGLLELMALSGLHIPAQEGSEISVFARIFADIGDEQSIEQSLSTFSSHMKNISYMVKKANDRTLILLDELGAGTDPDEGAALAVAILEYLRGRGSKVMATTHYSELKQYAIQTPRAENACCEFNVDTLSPTYRLIVGLAGKSNAFAIAKKLGLSQSIIDSARENLTHSQASFNDMMAELEDSRARLEREQQEAAAARAEAAALRDKAQKEKERTDRQRARILDQANEEAARILTDAKAAADEAIRNINKQAANPSGREMEKERKKLKGKLDEANERKKEGSGRAKKPPKASDLHIGDAVYVRSLGLRGTVSTKPDSKGRLYVQMGILRSEVSIADLELSEETGASASASAGRKSQQAQSSGYTGMEKGLTISPEINLIGMTTDEAIPLLDKYLDDAYIAHLDQVRIIHGRGTGALRGAVRSFLKSSPRVEHYRSGDFNEGGDGATIATFKS